MRAGELYISPRAIFTSLLLFVCFFSFGEREIERERGRERGGEGERERERDFDRKQLNYFSFPPRQYFYLEECVTLLAPYAFL